MSAIVNHIQRKDNPHNVTKVQVGLDKIENFPLASRQEVIDLSREDRYIDATRTDWVQEAFDNYLETLGLIDSDGNLVTNA